MMKTKTLSTALAASVGLAIAGVAISPAQAATLGGGTCSVSEVTITGYGSADNCAGFFSGNDKGGGTDPAISLLNDGLFGDFGSWVRTGTDGDFTGTGSGQTGTWNFAQGFSGPAAVAVKAGNSYSLYFFADVAEAYSGTFATGGVNTVGKKGNTPGLSHLSVFTAQRPSTPPPTAQSVPEPASILGLLAIGGLGIGLKRQRQS
jgi:hypothetical protein